MHFGTIKIHFTSVKAAIAASVDGSATAGKRDRTGRIRTWIAHVSKATATEDRATVLRRCELAARAREHHEALQRIRER